MSLIFEVKTWSCNNCQYYQDIDPSDAELMIKHFGYGKNLCPSCRESELTPETTKPMRVRIQDPTKAKKIKVDDGEGERDETDAELNARKKKLEKELKAIKADSRFKQVT